MKKIIFIPGLGHNRRDDLSVKIYSQRLIKALDENNSNHNIKYRVELSEQKYDDEGTLSSVVDIYEIDKDKEKKFIIYMNINMEIF